MPDLLSTDSSAIKKTGLELLNIIDRLAAPHIKNPLVEKFWKWFFVNHGKKIIENMDDQELKNIMRSGYEALKPIYEKTDVAVQLKESEKFNGPKINNFVKKLPDFADLLELID